MEPRCLVCGDFECHHNTSYHQFVRKVTTPEEAKLVAEGYYPNEDANVAWLRKYFPKDIAEKAIAERSWEKVAA